MNTAQRLHFEPRPLTSPCACGGDIPWDQSVSLASPGRDAVCDTCAEKIDPQAFAALTVLRAIDEAWWEIADRDAHAKDPTTGALTYCQNARRRDDASAYLRDVAAGVRALMEFYGASTEASPPAAADGAR